MALTRTIWILFQLESENSAFTQKCCLCKSGICFLSIVIACSCCRFGMWLRNVQALESVI